MTDWAVALLYATPVMVLAARVLFADQRSSPAHARPCGSVILPSAAIAFIMALPTFVQTTFLVRLPLAIAWPVLAASALWCVVVAMAWRHFIRRSDAGFLAQQLRGQALTIASLILFPKVAMWMWAVIA